VFRAFVASAIGFSVLTASCNRAPAEPVSTTDVWIDPSAASGTSPRGANPAASGDTPAAALSAAPAASACLRETPATPPPPVTAAPPTRCPKDPTPNAFLTTRTIDVNGTALEAEVAATDQESERGLMYRMNMPENHGMLFNLHVTKDHEFWMHNTCIPLDMMYIDENGRIVGVLENVPVLNDDPRSVGCPSRWVLEVNAGWSRRHGVKAGDKIRLPVN
jgi:uncharacterized protein